MINWGDYSIYRPPVPKLHSEMSRAEARLTYADVMGKKCARTAGLRRLLLINGLRLDDSPDSTDELGRWIYDNVEENPDQPGRLLGDWYSVVFDTGLYVGDLIISLNPHRHWVMQQGGRRHVAFQKAVIAGFPRDEKFSVDPDAYVAGIAYDSIKGRPVKSSPLWAYVENRAIDA